MKRKLLLICASLLALSGCATNDYALYAETQQKIAQSHAMSDVARYAALAEIAKQGDSAAKVAAVMSMQLGQGSGSGPRVQQINAPQSFGDKALQWTSVLLPSVTQLYNINATRQLGITQSNNQAAVATSTNNTFATMNGNMATSNTSIANAGLTAVTTTAANGLTAVTTTATNGLNAATTLSANSNTAITNVSNAANTSIQNLTNQIPNLQPNVTTTNNNNLICPAGTTLVNGSCV